MFIRFHGNYASPYTKQPYGIFVVIFHLQRNGKLSIADRKLYQTTVNWFEEHLPNPPFYKENQNSIRAVTWFKQGDKSQAMLEKLKPFFEIAERHGVDILQSISHEPPGKIIYEDDYQIGVVDCLG